MMQLRQKSPTYEPRIGNFLVRREKTPCLAEDLHFHAELELIYIIRGHGKRYIGNNIQSFREGEISLVGSNLPHLWRNDPVSYTAGGSQDAEVLIIQFLPDFMGGEFTAQPEFRPILDLFARANSGLQLTNSTLIQVKNLISDLDALHGLARIVRLLEVLELLSRSDHLSVISDRNSGELSSREHERLNNVIQYTLQHFQNPITLSQVSAQAGLSPQAFCRIFKKNTHHTYYSFLNQLRIEHAMALLGKTDMTIAEIAIQCGYQSITNFNRRFKAISGFTPRAYRANTPHINASKIVSV
jgi:AraC-like DNA-binding protein